MSSAMSSALSSALSISRSLHLFRDRTGQRSRSLQIWKRARKFMENSNRDCNLTFPALEPGLASVCQGHQGLAHADLIARLDPDVKDPGHGRAVLSECIIALRKCCQDRCHCLCSHQTDDREAAPWCAGDGIPATQVDYPCLALVAGHFFRCLLRPFYRSCARPGARPVIPPAPGLSFISMDSRVGRC